MHFVNLHCLIICIIMGNVGLTFPRNIKTDANVTIFNRSDRNILNGNINHSVSVIENKRKTEQSDVRKIKFTRKRISEEDNNSSLNETEWIYSEFERLQNWSELCTIKRKSNTSIHAFDMNCLVSSDSCLQFHIFRRFTTELPFPVLIDLYITCIGGYIRFPWPFRADKLNSLKIFNCSIKDYRTEFKARQIVDIPDTIKYFHIENITIISTLKEIFESRSLANSPITRPAECGPENAKVIIRRDITIKVEDLKNNEKYNDLYDRNVFDLQQTKCNRKYLEILDLSGHPDLDIKTLKKILNIDDAPNLKILNISRSHIRSLSLYKFEEYRSRFPLLEYFDMSHNRILRVPKFRDMNFNFKTLNIPFSVIDLRFNNISTITNGVIDILSRHKFLKIDLRENPNKCDCVTLETVKYIQDMNLSAMYNYLKTIKCYQPLNLQNRTFYTLDGNEMHCIIEKPTYNLLIILSLTAFLMFTCTLLLIYFKHQIKVFIYARVNIDVCRQGNTSTNGTHDYDAFVAYSEQDAKWVFNTILPKLEISSPKTLKLCLHHRDFIIGAPIAENIFESVQNSRQTILIVSHDFLKSEWCMMEFRTALRKGLREKNRHVILVIKDNNLDVNNIDSDLKMFISTYTYLTFGENFFWDKLKYALNSK